MTDKYDPDAKCPKCGNSHINTTYSGGLIEALLRKCLRCTYEWSEHTLDESEATS